MFLACKGHAAQNVPICKVYESPVDLMLCLVGACCFVTMSIAIYCTVYLIKFFFVCGYLKTIQKTSCDTKTLSSG